MLPLRHSYSITQFPYSKKFFVYFESVHIYDSSDCIHFENVLLILAFLFCVFHTRVFHTRVFHTRVFHTRVFYTRVFHTCVFYTRVFYTRVFFENLQV